MPSGNTVIGGEVDEDEKYISPTVVVDVTPSDPAMQEEVRHGNYWEKKHVLESMNTLSRCVTRKL